ncbi:hypothetical protein ACNKHU_25115 [Shigella flexneri]
MDQESKQWEGAFEGLTAGVNWHICGYRNDVSDLIDYDNSTLKYYNEGKARFGRRGVLPILIPDQLTHTVSYDYVDARNAITDTPLLRRAKQQVKYQLDWQLYDFFPTRGITYQYLGTRYNKDLSSYPSIKPLKWAVWLLGCLRLRIGHLSPDSSW